MRKKIMVMVLLTLALLWALGGCAPEAGTPTDSPETTAPTELSTDPPTDPPTEPPTGPAETLWDAAYFQALFDLDMYRGEKDWYNRALTSYYSTPEEIDLYKLFYSGFPGESPDPTPEELDFLRKQPYFSENYDLQRLPTADMDGVMQKYFGITLENCRGVGLDEMVDEGLIVYWEETDCWYCWHTDSGLMEYITVTDCAEQDDGTYRVSYTVGDWDPQAAVVVMKPTEEGWQYLSNLPADQT